MVVLWRVQPEFLQAALDALNALPRSSDIPWFTIFLAVFLLGGFAWGYWQGGAELGGELVLQWALITATINGNLVLSLRTREYVGGGVPGLVAVLAGIAVLALARRRRKVSM